ncbi:MAG: 4-hydroxyphenylacetate 3-hydroxylase family protein, partial [Clostridiales Family XIII bacterium]|nr:4-hydroxyphenylacetate 3-hydroxylase family protein [Clostridiales Family XIII bacterium]
KLEPGADVDLGNKQFGGQEALVVFDNVFVPNEYIFQCEEAEFAGMMVERFAGYHRQSYGGCKVGVGDVIIGAAALAAEYNGAAKASHIKDKLIEMTHLNETLYSCGIACSCEGHPTAAGNYQIDLLLANVCKQNVTRFPYEIVRLAEDIAGGLMVTMPSELDFKSTLPVPTESGLTLGDWCNKFFKGTADVPTENRMRILRFLENICLGASAVGYRTESMHGAGSPQAQRIMISRQGDIEGKKQLAKDIAGIK